jgi:hypothetical protein
VISPPARPGVLAGATTSILLVAGAIAASLALAAAPGEGERRSIAPHPDAGATPVDPALPALAGLDRADRRRVLEFARLPLGARTPRPSAAPAGAAAEAPAPARSSHGGPLVNTDLRRIAGSQASSAVAIDRSDTERVLAASNDATSAGPLLVLSDRRLAAGSGARLRIPPATAVSDGSPATQLAICCEPALAAGDDGIWVAATAGGMPTRIVVNRVPPGAQGLRPVNAAIPALVGAPLQHKPAIAVSDDAGRLAVAWIATSPAGQRVVVSGCDIGGGPGPCESPASWSEPAPLTPAAGNVTMPDLAFGPSGDLYAVWWNAGEENAIEGARCPAAADCSQPAAWDPTIVVSGLDAHDDDGDGTADPLPLRCPIIAAPGGLVGPSPSIVVGPGEEVMVSFSDLRPNGAPGNDTRCTAAGSDRTFDSFLAVGGAPGELPSGSRQRVSKDAPLALNDHFLPALAIEPASGLVAISFYTTAGDPSGQFPHRAMVVSGDGGSTFTPPMTLTSAPSRMAGTYSDGIEYGDRQGLGLAPDGAVAVWTDARAIQGHDADLYALAPGVRVAIDSAPTSTIPDPFAQVRFSTPAPRTRCSHNGTAFRPCTSPHSLGPLPNRAHRLEVEATDDAGNAVGAARGVATWRVEDLEPPETTITKRPRNRIKAKRPRFRFVADEVGATFQCRYDREAWRNCRSPARGKVSVGRHTFRVRATDVGGNVDASPAVAKFRRMPACWSRKHGRKRCR